MSIYFDNSATTKPFDETISAVEWGMNMMFYNPSALYRPAVEASKELAQIRGSFAQALGVRSEEIVFTSGGTESNNLAIFGSAGRKPMHCLVNASEHSSVHEVFEELRRRGNDVEYLENDHNGCVTIEELKKKLRPNTALVSIMHVNNETGAINQIEKLAAIAKRVAPHCVFHSDGVQAFLKVPMPSLAQIDAYSMSGHKFHAPRGTGVLYIKKGTVLHQLMLGGSQENHLRPGTENTPGIFGLGAALKRYRIHMPEYQEQMRAVKVRLAKRILALPDVKINGPDIWEGAPHILSVGFAGVPAQTLQNALSEREIYCGTGSACSSKSSRMSRSLSAMHVPQDFARGTLRFSFCFANTIQEADAVGEALEELLPKLRRFKKR